eukprot:GHVU01225788.1.p1 GENE.GHVU01225788.1~~GHVU01225788.1.p1  ORF type:complete len:100 (+),score=10.03 GHVU01225788.1:298-597(+)
MIDSWMIQIRRIQGEAMPSVVSNGGDTRITDCSIIFISSVIIVIIVIIIIFASWLSGTDSFADKRPFWRILIFEEGVSILGRKLSYAFRIEEFRGVLCR